MRVRVVLAAAALSLAVLAVLAGDPVPRASSARSDGAGDRPVVSRIDAVTLAERIRARDPYLRVIDVRAAAAFADFAIPTATHIELGGEAAIDVDHNVTLVVYASDDSTAGRLALRLTGAGHPVVRVLDGGIDAWIADVLEPQLLVDATVADSQSFQRAAAVARYFGGTPRTSVGRATADAADDPRGRPPARRGCGHDG